MADLTITAANVIAGANAKTKMGKAGATVAAGDVVYQDPTTKKWSLADTDSATAAVRDATGIALNGASDGQPLMVHLEGDLTIGATLTLGMSYYLSGNAGKIAPYADLAQGDYPVLIGLAKSASVLNVKFVAAGVAIP